MSFGISPQGAFMSFTVPIIVGPTAVGKTALSVLLSGYFSVEVVSADSRQIYKYMDIGTAKPDKSILEKIPHHFIDILEPDAYYSAGMYGKEARQVIWQIQQHGRIPLVVGGSGLYIRALVDGLFEADLRDDSLRKELADQTKRKGLPAMFEQLKAVDPLYAQKISPGDEKRILRALEVWELSGQRFSDLQKQTRKADFEPRFFGLTADRNILYERINRRVDKMLEQGLLDEVRRLRDAGYTPPLNALNTVGYKEAFAYLDGAISYEEMTEQIKRNSRRYAKRQLTWFRQDERIEWTEINSEKDLQNICREIARRFNF